MFLQTNQDVASLMKKHLCIGGEKSLQQLLFTIGQYGLRPIFEYIVMEEKMGYSETTQSQPHFVGRPRPTDRLAQSALSIYVQVKHVFPIAIVASFSHKEKQDTILSGCFHIRVALRLVNKPQSFSFVVIETHTGLKIKD